MTTYEFDGYVHSINRQKWGTEVVVRLDQDESMVKYPQHILFFASSRKADKVPSDLYVNDGVKVKFVPVLDEGISERTKRAYAINKMMILDIQITQRAALSNTAQDESQDDSDVPF
jgi:hypothetical protein